MTAKLWTHVQANLGSKNRSKKGLTHFHHGHPVVLMAAQIRQSDQSVAEGTRVRFRLSVDTHA